VSGTDTEWVTVALVCKCGHYRDLADFIEETTSDEDMARRDASALRKAAFDADGEEDPDA
jgi:hypothetical protein